LLDTYLPLCPLKARLFLYNWITIASDCVRYNYLQVIIFCERKVLCIAADIDNTHSILAKMFGEKREHKFPSTILPTIIYQLSEENQNEKPILNSSIQVPAAKYASPCSRDFYFYFIFHLFKTVRHIVLTSICSFQISNDLLYPILCGKIDKEKTRSTKTHTLKQRWMIFTCLETDFRQRTHFLFTHFHFATREILHYCRTYMIRQTRAEASLCKLHMCAIIMSIFYLWRTC
jgi:hypothetical protein